MADNKGKGKKRRANSNSNVENITNAVSNLKNRLGVTTNQALKMLANRAGTSRQHRVAQTVRQAAAPGQAASNAGRRVMNSTDLLRELAKKMNARTLVEFGKVGRQQRDVAKEQLPKLFGMDPAFFDRTAERASGRPITKADLKLIGTAVAPPQSGPFHPEVNPRYTRITKRIPAVGYDQATREDILRHIERYTRYMQRVNLYKLYHRIEESLLAAALDNPRAVYTLELQGLVDVFRGNMCASTTPQGVGACVRAALAVIRRMGKAALWIVAVHLMNGAFLTIRPPPY